MMTALCPGLRSALHTRLTYKFFCAGEHTEAQRSSVRAKAATQSLAHEPTPPGSQRGGQSQPPPPPRPESTCRKQEPTPLRAFPQTHAAPDPHSTPSSWGPPPTPRAGRAPSRLTLTYFVFRS